MASLFLPPQTPVAKASLTMAHTPTGVNVSGFQGKGHRTILCIEGARPSPALGNAAVEGD